jgi:zinc transport system substrate-binding protein
MNAGLEIPAQHDAAEHAEEAEHHHHDADEHAEEAEHHHHHRGMDPHVWTAPAGMRVMTANTLNALVELDPANAAAYRTNCAAFLEEIDALDARIRGLYQDVAAERRTFLVFHPAWGHFAEAYGLTQLSIEVDGKEPGPAELARIITEAREHGVRAVFIQPQMSKRTALSVAGAVGARVIEADPLASDWEANLLSVAESFRSAMK